MFPNRLLLVLAILGCAALYAASRLTLPIRPAQAQVATAIEGKFTAGGWYEGEPFVTEKPVRAWGSWSGSDENTGTLTIGPFAAPRTVRFAIGGYPTHGDIQLYLELPASRERIRLQPADVGERWRIIAHALPRTWEGQPMQIVAVDNSKVLGGWIAVTEPIRGGRDDRAAALWTSLAAWSINGLLLGVLWVASIRILVARTALAPQWVPLVAAAMVAAAGYLTFWAYFARAGLGQITSFALFAAGLVVLWKIPRGTRPLPDVTAVGRLVVTVGAFYLGLLHLFPTSLTFYQLAANRFREALPADNFLPHLAAARLYAGEPLRRADADWLSSDRPPLQSGWQLLTWPVTARLKFDRETASGTGAVWLQLTWIAAAYGMLRTLGLGARRASGWIAVLALSGFFLQHTVFTWPKLSAGAFACGAFGLWVLPAPDEQRRQNVLVGAVLAALAWLSHGGVAFSFLVLAPWILWRAARGGARGWAQAALVFAVFALPWAAYQKFYDPPGNRLLKWHLGGQQDKDARGTWETIRASYAALTWSQWAEHKRLNFHSQINGDWSGLVDVAPERAKDRRNEEFAHPGRALTWWLGGLIVLPFVVARIAGHAQARTLGRMHVALFLWTALTIPLWCLLLFSGGTAVVHQGSYAMMISAFVLLCAWFELAGRGWLISIAVLQGLSLAFTWAVGSNAVNGTPEGIALGLVVAAGTVLGAHVVAATRESAAVPATMPQSIPAETTAPSRLSRAWPALAAVLALAPFVWCLHSFAGLWWFGDDWDLIERINKVGFWRWTIEPFAENFVPLFKVLWGGMVFASGGSYLPMITVLWITHALNTALLGRSLRSAGFSWFATVPAVAVFALSYTNIETLAWSVQWSALLAITFFLLAAERLLHPPASEREIGAKSLALLALLSLASALAFARGVLTGASLAAVCLLPFGIALRDWRSRLATAAACLLPAVGVAATIYFFSPGNHHALGGHWREIIAFGLSYWAATPLYRLFEISGWDSNWVILVGGIKVAIMVWAWSRATIAQRPLLLLLLFLDLGNAVLLGIGRFQTGLPASNSERYQYNALLCTMPFLGLALEAWITVLPWPRLRRILATVLMLLIGYRATHGWPQVAERFAADRGRNTKDLLLRPQDLPAVGAVPGIPFLPTERARELIVIYHLH